MGEDDIDDMTDVVDEPVSRDDNDWMALALERKMRQDAKKNREKTQERLNTVRQGCKLYDTFAVFGSSCSDSECSKKMIIHQIYKETKYKHNNPSESVKGSQRDYLLLLAIKLS